VVEFVMGKAKYYVEHRGRRYPIKKQVLSAVAGLPKAHS
jgi:hypothetical protein